jgi:hypothetical protein
MKLHFNFEDLEQRFVSMLAEEGIGVASMQWGQDDGLPTLEVEMGELPDTSKKPLRTIVAELQDEIAALKVTVEALSIVVKEKSASVVINHEPPKNVPPHRRGKGGPDITKPPVVATPPSPPTGRMAKALAQMAEDEKFIGDPRGSGFRVGQRPLGANESEEFPG